MGGCGKCKWQGEERGSSCLALPRAGRSQRKKLQTQGAFCPRAWLCKRWGKGQEFLELVHSLESPWPAGATMGEGVADSGLEGLEMRMTTQQAVDRTNRLHSLQHVNLQASQTPSCFECGHKLVPPPLNCHSKPPSGPVLKSPFF